jgi:hypothetical protein
LILLFDPYSVHRCALVSQVAEELAIELVFLSPRCIDKLQPLDYRIFGILNA